ncbi:TPA: super-infection exclusion protein B [Proteus mirabilis]|nr:super-infection exclusion protein B [Proteus mirabilis]
MPNWIEAVIAYLKQNTSLRFNMVWLFTWLLLLLFVPDSVSHFVNGKIHFFNIPYVGVTLILIPVSFFISYFLKWLWSSLIGMPRNIKESLKFRRTKIEIQSLSEREKEIILCLIDGDDIDDFENDEDGIYVYSLMCKGIIHEYHDTYITKYKLDSYYRNAIVRLLVEAHEAEQKINR